MINKNELRLGNYFNTFLNDVFQVDELKSKFVMGKSDNGFCNTTYEEIEPIPLTPEILEKAGFEVKYGEGDRRSSQSRTLAETEGISVIFYNSDKIFFINIKGFVLKRPFLKYLHQLQNLYFSLTGQELEINL